MKLRRVQRQINPNAIKDKLIAVHDACVKLAEAAGDSTPDAKWESCVVQEIQRVPEVKTAIGTKPQMVNGVTNCVKRLHSSGAIPSSGDALLLCLSPPHIP